MKRKEKDIVQIKNPRSGRYIKIDRSAGGIISHKRTKGPYKGINIILPKGQTPTGFPGKR